MTGIIGIIRAVLLVQPALAEAVKIPTCVSEPVILFFEGVIPPAIRCMTHELNTLNNML